MSRPAILEAIERHMRMMRADRKPTVRFPPPPPTIPRASRGVSCPHLSKPSPNCHHRGVIHTLLVAIIIAIAAAPARAEPWSLEYRAWSGFYGSSSFELRYRPAESPFGLRLWSAHGWDDDHCASFGQCFENHFVGADITYRLSPRTSVYLGHQHLWRTLEWVGQHHTMFHTGFRIGVMGEVRLAERLAFTYDVALVPTDHFANTWDAGAGSGGMYDFSVRYELSESTFVRAGWWSFGSNLPNERCCDFAGHIWLGPYIAFGMRF